MKINYKLFSSLLTGVVFSLHCIGQSGCPAIDAGPDVVLDSTGCTTLIATALETGETESYKVDSIPYSPPYPFDAGTQILAGIDDTWSNVINLPFTFCFFGTSYTQLVAGGNGLITFDLTTAGAFCPWSYTATLPSQNIPMNAIYSPYHDLDPAISGNMYYAVLGSYPCRTIVVSWNEVPMYSVSCNSLLATHMIVLYETTNIIEVYVQDAPVCSTWNSGNKCIGIQNSDGTIGYAPPGRNTGAWSATDEAWRFTPDGTPNFTVSWWQGATLIANSDSVTVCPTSTTQYTAQIEYVCCNGSIVTVTDDVSVTTNSGINDGINTNNNISIIPNPAHDRVYIKTTEKNYTIEIYDYTGRELLKEKFANDQSIDISGLAKGAYILKITNNKTTFIKKIIKN
jgi:hypothetical protein